MPKKDISKMGDEELEALNNDLDAQIADLKAQKAEVTARLDQINIENETQRMLEHMSNDQKAALLQSIQAEGVSTAEAVNTSDE